MLQVATDDPDACHLACAGNNECNYFVTEKKKGCTLYGGLLTAVDRSAATKKMTSYSMQCPSGKDTFSPNAPTRSCQSFLLPVLDECKIKKLGVKRGEVLLTIEGVSEKECKLACADKECYAVTYDKKAEVCTAYSSVEKEKKSGKLTFTPWKCPIGTSMFVTLFLKLQSFN